MSIYTKSLPPPVEKRLLTIKVALDCSLLTRIKSSTEHSVLKLAAYDFADPDFALRNHYVRHTSSLAGECLTVTEATPYPRIVCHTFR